MASISPVNNNQQSQPSTSRTVASKLFGCGSNGNGQKNNQRLTIDPHAELPGFHPWVKVASASTYADAGPADSGIFTTDQIHSIAITLIDIRENETMRNATWKSARMAHVTYNRHPILMDPRNGFYDDYINVPRNDLRVVIACKEDIAVGSIPSTLQAFLPNLEDENILIYRGSQKGPMSFGVAATGEYGEA